MSIAASVPAQDLFGYDPMQLHFKERLDILNNLLQKFLVVNDEHRNFQMKVDNNQIPISEYIEEETKKDKLSKNAKEKKGEDFENAMIQTKCTEYKEKKQEKIDSGQVIQFYRIAEIDGLMHDIEMLLIKKVKAKTEKSGKNKAKMQ